jgi:hypothetical protein
MKRATTERIIKCYIICIKKSKKTICKKLVKTYKFEATAPAVRNFVRKLSTISKTNRSNESLKMADSVEEEETYKNSSAGKKIIDKEKMESGKVRKYKVKLYTSDS